MPRVLYLTDSLGAAGSERQLALLVKYLPQTIERQVCSLSRGEFVQTIEETNTRVTVVRRHFRYDASILLKFSALIAHFQPDLVHSWGWISTVAAIPTCRAKQIPLIDGTIRMGMRPRRRAMWQWLGLSLADGVIANSRAGMTAWNIPASKGRVIYNGFDPERLRLCPPRGDRGTSPFGVGMVGRMSLRKDYPSFLCAARHILDNTDANMRFVAVGDGELRQMLFEAAKPMVNAGRFQFPEPTTEVLPIVNKLDVGVLMSHPSLHAEGCSNAIMEYMACGLPVICSRGGGNAELVVEGKTGFLVPSGDWKTLADILLYLYGHREVAAAMGANGRQRLLANFSTEKMVSETVDFYTEVLHKAHKP